MSFFESIFYMAWRGIAIGLIISAPMGPVGMLCIQRTLDKGRRAGFYTGMGAALSDLFYSLLTGFGLSFIEEFLERNQNIIQLAGSIVLIAFGVYLFRKNPSKGLTKPVEETVSKKKSILGGFLFTFSNPLILFLTIGLFARFNFLLPEFHAWQYFTGFAFIFVGAILWWWFITFTIDKLRSHFNIRSMWLINKIIGVIILIFAIVGIFTAVSGLASANDTRCWNAARGYEPFANPEGGNRLKNPGPDTAYYIAAVGDATSLEFRGKVKNHTTRKPWGMVLEGYVPGSDGRQGRVTIDFRCIEGEFDGLSTRPELEVEVRIDGFQNEAAAGAEGRRTFGDTTPLTKRIKRGMQGPDPTGSLNFYKLTLYNDLLVLTGGLHSPELLVQAALPENFHATGIGYYLGPGGSISPDEIRLTADEGRPRMTDWGDSALLSDYLAHSRSPMEGYWQILDRSLEESLLRLGGNYRLALVREGDGYDLLYISGARINADNWEPGMLKASLRPSGIEGVWDVCWIDAMHRPLSHDLKAQMDKNGTLTILFPYQNSTVRLHPAKQQPIFSAPTDYELGATD